VKTTVTEGLLDRFFDQLRRVFFVETQHPDKFSDTSPFRPLGF
jgi:hypothetical protein